MSSTTPFKPWQRAPDSAKQQPAGTKTSRDESGEGESAENTPQSQSVKAVVEDVLDRTHRAINEERQAKVTERGFAKAIAKLNNVTIKGPKLTVADKTFELTPEQTSSLSILEPQRQILLGLADALKSGSPSLISVPEGVDAGATARWFLDVAGTPQRYTRISRLTSLDSLAGALRPDGSGNLRVQHGPLTECIMHGGVFVADGIEQADKDVLAILTALAKGAKEFHHPVSGSIVPVHPDFRLVLVTSNRGRYASDLTSACALTEVKPYSKDDHARLLTERAGLPAQTAAVLADFHEQVKAAQLSDRVDNQIDYGRGFPLAWPLLERVAARLHDVPNAQASDIADAFWAVYGARLASPASAEAFRNLLKRSGLPLSAPIRLAPNADGWEPIANQVEAWNLAEAAHRAGEAIMINGPGQSGVTTMVKKLGERFHQDVITVMCGPGVDPQSLIERPVFTEGFDPVRNVPTVKIEFMPGVVADALLKGKLLYFDHFDHLPVDRQEALLRLVESKTLQITKDGKVVDVPVHPDARIVFSTTAGSHRTRHSAPARERALVTEVRVNAPTLEDAFAIIPSGMRPELRAEVERVAGEIFNESRDLGVTKLLRFKDFVGAADLLAPYMTTEQAVGQAARLFFDDNKGKSKVIASLAEAPEGNPPVWMQMLAITQEQVRDRVAGTGYSLVPSMNQYLLPLVIASKLGCYPDASGPAAAGKTVLGVVFGAIIGKPVTRVNVSAGTETSDFFGGLGPVMTDNGVRFVEIPGPVPRSLLERGMLSIDEWNLSGDAGQAFKSMLDRGASIDPNTGVEQKIGSSMLFFSRNPIGTRGRQEQSPVIEDAMMRIFVRAKPVEERADIVASQCGLDRNWKTSVSGGLLGGGTFDPVLSIAKFFEDLDVVWREHRAKLGPTQGPLTCTERDMVKVARRVDYLIKRDNMTDPSERRRMLGREAFRLMRGLVTNEAGQNFVFDTLIKKHFGADVPKLKRPDAPKIVDVMIDGKPRKALQIGIARMLVRENADASVPAGVNAATWVSAKTATSKPTEENVVYDRRDIANGPTALDAAGTLQVGARYSLTVKDVAPPVVGAIVIHDVGDRTVGGRVLSVTGNTFTYEVIPLAQELVPSMNRIGEPVGAQIQFLEDALFTAELDQAQAVVGITGSGKTMLVRYLAHMTNTPLIEQAYHADMTEENIFGQTILTPKGEVKFQQSPLDIAMQVGAWYVGDELLTLPNKTRESLNPVTEGSEFQRPSRPPVTIKRKDWHPDFRLWFTTNGDDIRDDSFSDPEASRIVIQGILEPRGFDDLNTFAQRDFGSTKVATLYSAPRSFEKEDRTLARNAVLALLERNDPMGAAFKRATIDLEASKGVGGFFRKMVGGVRPEETELEDQVKSAVAMASSLSLDEAGEHAIADSYWQFAGPDFVSARRCLDIWVSRLSDPLSVVRIQSMAPPGALTPDVLVNADKLAVNGKRLVAPSEIGRLVHLFDDLRTMQGEEGASPLTPRLLTSFLELYIEKRRNAPTGAAAMRAAELTLLSKMPRSLEAGAVDKVVRAMGEFVPEAAELLVPRQERGGVWYGNTNVPVGSDTPWQPSNERFPLTPARVQNLACIADADVMGRGRPISLTDDANGESMETLREYARLCGKRLIVVTLTPNTDIEQLIEKLVLTDDPDVIGGFAPELQEIAQAVKEGHLLALRGCGSVPSGKLERLNSLGDGRGYVDLPRSARQLETNPGFRMFMLRKPGAPHQYSPALENRLLEPLLSTRAQTTTQESLARGASELLENIHHRTQISVESARLLARFHVCLNELLRKGEFASSLAVGSFLNRDAESVARRLKHLQLQGAVTDEVEMLHRLVVDVYGERFDNESDRELFAHLARKFITDKMSSSNALNISATQHFVRFGDWSVPRDSRGIRSGVPDLDAILPRIDGLDDIQAKLFAAEQFGETVQLHGDGFVGRAAIQSFARLAASEIVEIEGNEELNESSLFGGLVQNDDGQFERYEGLVWRAQAEGSILFIRNAARLPRDVLMRLAEIAATDNIERVKDGQLEIQQKRLRLVLQTSAGDPPLPQELAAACTRVRCEPVTQRRDLVALTSHVLEGVPGGASMAAAFVDLFSSADAAIAGVSFQGRQPVRFDGQRLLFLAADVAKAAKAADADLEDVVAAAIVRHVSAPLAGLRLESVIEPAIQRALEQLYGSGGVLTAQKANTIDVVANPHLAALKQDYDQVVGTFTGALVKSTAEAVNALVAANDQPRLKLMLADLPAGGLFPVEIERLIASALATGNGDATIPEKMQKPIGALVKALDATTADITHIESNALELMRGARLWDLEHRVEIVKRYDRTLEMCRAAGSAFAVDACGAFGRVRERFDAAAAEKMIAGVRGNVEKAFAAYQSQSGGTDNVLHERYEKVVERWDWVTGTPLFKNHHQLRGHLGELHTALDGLRNAHDERGAPRDEVKNLLAALRGAGETLEGIRIAEQSADLRRDVENEQRGTQELVDELVSELTVIRQLRAVKEEHALLTRTTKYITEQDRSEFLHLKGGKVHVERPALRTKADLLKEATSTAANQLRDRLETERAELFIKLAEMGSSRSQSPEHAFDDYDLGSANIGFNAPKREGKAPRIQSFYEEGLARIDRDHEARIVSARDRTVEELAATDAENVEKLHRERTLAEIDRVATRISTAAVAMSRGLQQLKGQLGNNVAPEVYSAIEDACAVLRKTETGARDWGESFRRKSSLKSFFGKDERSNDPLQSSLEIPDISSAVNTVRHVLGLAGESAQLQLGGLPDASRLEEHVAVAASLSDSLANADTLGQLSARFSLLNAAAEKNADMNAALQTVLGRIATDASTRELLLRIAAFSETADTLSSRFARESGVQLSLASLVEATMRAAQLIRQEKVRDKSTRACLNALDQVLKQFDGTKQFYSLHDLPVALQGVEAEVTALRESFSGAQSAAKSLSLKDAGVDALLDVLSISAPDTVSADRIRAAMSQDLGLKGEPEARIEPSASAAMRVTRSTTVEAIQRDTELRLIDLSVVGLSAATDAVRAKADKKNDAEARKAVTDAVEYLRDTAVAAADAVNSGRQTGASLLSSIEEQSKKGMLARAQELMQKASDGLAKVVQAQGSSYKALRADVIAAFAAVAQARAVVEPSDVFPIELVGRLRKIVDSAKALETTFEQSAFERSAFTIAAQALTDVKEAQYALAETASKSSRSASGPDAGARLRDVRGLIEGLSTAGDTLTAYSRSTLLGSWASRLENLAQVIGTPDDATASALAAQARKASTELARLSPTQVAERNLAESLATLAELAQHLTASSGLDMEQAMAFTELVKHVNALSLSKANARDVALQLVAEASETVVPFLSLANKAGGASARDFESSVRGFRTELLRSDVAHLTQALASGAGAYLTQTLQLAASLSASRTAFATYDPTASLAVESLGQSLTAGVQDATANLSGPLAGRIGIELSHVFETLDQARNRPGVSTEADKLLKELQPMRKKADVWAQLSAAADRYDRIIVKTRDWLDRTSTGVLNAAALEQADAVVKAVVVLKDVSPESAAKQLEALEEKYFRGSVSGLQLDPPAAAKIEVVKATAATPVIVSSLAGRTSLKDEIASAIASETSAAQAAAAARGDEGRGTYGASSGPGDPTGPASTSGAVKDAVAPVAEPQKEIDSANRTIVGEGKASQGNDFKIIAVDDVQVQDTLNAMEQSLIAKRASAIAGDSGVQVPLTAIERFIGQNQDLVKQMQDLVRKYPCEISVVVDQSSSTKGEIIANEQAVVGLILAAIMGGEGNCAVVGMGDNLGASYGDRAVPGTEQNQVQAWLLKGMSTPMSVPVADKAYMISGIANGNTSLIPSMQVAFGQFTSKANDKFLLVMTDAEVSDAAAIRTLIGDARDKGISVGMLGFGAAANIKTVAGDWGEHVTSYRDAVTGAAKLMTRALVSNGGRFKGQIQSTGGGIGTAFIDAPLSAAPSVGPMASSLRLSQTLATADEPAEVLGADGEARDLDQLSTRSIYDAAHKNLEATQRSVQNSASYRKCLVEVRELEARHNREGTSARLRDGITMSLPRAGGTELMRKQLSGPLLDEEQLPLYVAGLAQGMPVLRIFKKKKGSDELRAQVVIAIDESTSMGDTDKMRANVEAALAYGDALKSIDPNIQVAVIGYSDRVRLHAAFEQEWGTELKAHVLHQVRGEYDATDDERGIAEGIALLDMLESDVGQIVAFTDGQGLPGTHEVVKQGQAKGYSVIIAGVGAECKGVLQFGKAGLFARNLSQFVQQVPNVALQSWEAASRLVSG